MRSFLDLFCPICKHYMKPSLQVPLFVPREVAKETFTHNTFIYKCQHPKCGFCENWEIRPTK